MSFSGMTAFRSQMRDAMHSPECGVDEVQSEHQLKIEGHCDERGTSAYNLVLGEKRAKAVRNYLVELGVVPDHLSVVSYGKERPFCTEHAESCYSQNRRGHLVVRTGNDACVTMIHPSRALMAM
ncbi:MAG: OmpA family protein [Nitrospira sp.]|nr:OmpA family protein [Nitrospira sp.]